MSVVFTVVEKFTLRDPSMLPQNILNAFASEEERIEVYRGEEFFFKRILIDTGDGWREMTGMGEDTLRFALIRSMLSENHSISVYVACEYTWRAGSFLLDEEKDVLDVLKRKDPGFYIESLIKDGDDSLFENFSFEFFHMADCSGSDRCGSLRQYYRRADGTVFRGEAEYDRIDSIPDGEWSNEPLTLYVSHENFSVPHDPDALNEAARVLNETEYYPKDGPIDFRDPGMELFINQPKLETAEQRDAFFRALEAMRVATGGEMIFEQPEFFDWTDGEVRKLMLDMDHDTGALRFYMTKPIPPLPADGARPGEPETA